MVTDQGERNLYVIVNCLVVVVDGIEEQEKGRKLIEVVLVAEDRLLSPTYN